MELSPKLRAKVEMFFRLSCKRGPNEYLKLIALEPGLPIKAYCIRFDPGTI